MPEYGGDPDAVPLVALGMEVTASTGNPGEAMARVLQGLGQSGIELGDVAADGAYFPTAGHALAVKALGGNPIYHMHENNQQGLHGVGMHAIWIDGRPYCRCMPKQLHKLRYPRFPHERHLRRDYWDKLKEREPFAFKPHGVPRKDGSQRWSTAHNGNCLTCHGRDAKCCRQRTVIFSARDLANAQHEVFGSENWVSSYARRSLVEGFFGVLKMATELCGENVRFHTHGKIAFAYALMVAATNMHLVQTWNERRAAKQADPDRPTRRERRRRKKKHEDLAGFAPTPDGKLPDPAPPPDDGKHKALPDLYG